MYLLTPKFLINSIPTYNTYFSISLSAAIQIETFSQILLPLPAVFNVVSGLLHLTSQTMQILRDDLCLLLKVKKFP